jgi:hypothetical protein
LEFHIMPNNDTHNIDIDAAESRIEELRGEYIAARQVHTDAIGALPDDAALRDMDTRRDKAAELTRDALSEQERIAGELVEAAADALTWAQDVLDAGDFSDGLDSMDRESLTRVFDRAVIRGDKARALAAAQLLDADGDKTALPRFSANYPDDVGAALGYVAEWGDATRVLDTLRTSTVKIPSDERIRPSVAVARQHAAEDAERRAAEEAAAHQARRELHAEMNRTISGGVARSDESRQRAKRTPVRGGGRGGRGALGRSA